MADQDQEFEIALAEIRIASPDLADFLVWAAHQGEDGDDNEEAHDFVSLCNYVYSYARAKNEGDAQDTADRAEAEDRGQS